MAEMKTPEVRQSEIKGFLRLQKQQGGIIPTKLKGDQKVLVETNSYMFELRVLDTPAGRRYVLDTGSPMCKGHTVVTHILSHSSKLKYNMEDWIGKDMRMVLKFTTGQSIMTGEVRGATVTGETQNGEPYEFDFWKV
jgi:hypothetical protein